MNIERVLEIFGSLTGLSEDNIHKYRSLCELSAKHLQEMLKDGEESDDGGRVDFAAAALAYYRYVLWSVTDGGDVTVGDVSVKNSSGRLAGAEALYKEALKDIRELIEDEGFVFERI